MAAVELQNHFHLRCRLCFIEDIALVSPANERTVATAMTKNLLRVSKNGHKEIFLEEIFPFDFLLLALVLAH